MDFKDNDKLRSLYPTFKFQGLNCRNYGTPFPVHFPLFSHTRAIKLHWNLVHRSHFSTFHLILKATWLICYCILSSLPPRFWFSAKLTKGYMYKSVNILNSFIPYHQISSYLPTFTKFTKFLLYHMKLKKKRGNIE